MTSPLPPEEHAAALLQCRMSWPAADGGLPERLTDLIPDGMTIWEDDDELGYFADRDLRWWMKALGHDRLHTACCASCGCCVTCTAQMFHGAMVASVIRELGKLGALREPAALPEETTDHD